ncbi:hypothetical protein AXG89_41600 (plasmid) [Burkholderia sp. PAMC 26561]|nr:hypothetical protein AXG89_41450 [Burkholderia sp. PAMC 26561]AMH42821.1 hypothetical protein AXG89_41600 [Burkholderia sp. PAMC 26561]
MRLRLSLAHIVYDAHQRPVVRVISKTVNVGMLWRAQVFANQLDIMCKCGFKSVMQTLSLS